MSVAEDLDRLVAYFKSSDYVGWDPYDGLESGVFKATPLCRSKWARLVMIQAVKRSPWNLRRALRVPQGRNPKGIGLCASAWVCRSQVESAEKSLAEAADLLDWLLDNRIRGYEGDCWGYNFAWQSRSFFASRGTPNAICTIFAARAFLDMFDRTGDSKYLEVAGRAVRFLFANLKVEENDELHFRYIPTADSQVHNVNLLAAALVARLASRTGDSGNLDVAHRAVSFSVRRQRPDGSWPYGEASNQQWIDNYHTGFNLVALAEYHSSGADDSFHDAIAVGHRFWSAHFFSADGAPKFYATQLYPIDIHCVAQSMLTDLEFVSSDGEAMQRCLRTYWWTRAHLRSDTGDYYFQKHAGYTIKTPFVRWGQSWMFRALAGLYFALHLSQNPEMSSQQRQATCPNFALQPRVSHS